MGFTVLRRLLRTPYTKEKWLRLNPTLRKRGKDPSPTIDYQRLHSTSYHWFNPTQRGRGWDSSPTIGYQRLNPSQRNGVYGSSPTASYDLHKGEVVEVEPYIKEKRLRSFADYWLPEVEFCWLPLVEP